MPPILLMKRTLDDLEDLDDFDDFDGSEDEVELVEPQAKRLRDRSPIAKEESSGEKNVQTEEKYIETRYKRNLGKLASHICGTRVKPRTPKVQTGIRERKGSGGEKGKGGGEERCRCLPPREEKGAVLPLRKFCTATNT